MPDSDLQPIDAVLSSRRALEFIADAGELLSSSLDYEQTLRQVARLAVPELADWCAVYIAGNGDGEDELEITSGHPDPALEVVLQEIRRRRREVDGASESRRVAESAEPILARDVRRFSPADVDESLRPLLERLASKSYMLVPLLARGRSIGSLTLLSTREHRHYGDEDLSFAQTLAARCALAIDNAQTHDAAERSLSLLDTIFATAPVGLAFVDRDLRFVRTNAMMGGFDAEAELLDVCRSVLDSKQPVHDLELDGARHWNVSCAPVHGPGGDLLGVSAVVLDVTERARLLQAEREARVRADFLARAGGLLDESLDYERTLSAIAEIAVPEIADWCAVSVLDERGILRQLGAAHADPAQRELGEELTRRYPPDPASDDGPIQVARTGRTQFVPEITDELLTARIEDPEQLELVRRLGLRSVIIAALRAHGRTFGTLSLASSGRIFDAADVQLAEELARRAGTALDNARLYTERTHIAHALQTKLLPERLPDIPGALLAARYRAAGELNEVGGDFYDVYPRSGDQWAMVVGDVSGKGPEAAAVTALARYTLRAGAQDDDTPEKALRRLNSALRAHDDTDQFATAALAFVSAVDEDRVAIRLALAGHPPAVLVRGDGSLENAGRFGTMLAAVPDPAFVETEHVLERGDALVLYTDGVTEAGPRTRLFGDHGFAELLRTLAGQPPQTIVDAVERAAVDAQDGRPRDDIALLALALAPT